MLTKGHQGHLLRVDKQKKRKSQTLAWVGANRPNTLANILANISANMLVRFAIYLTTFRPTFQPTFKNMKYSLLSISGTSTGPKKMVPLIECSTYPNGSISET